MTQMTFGQWLGAQRRDRRLSLREVEALTDGAVSNSYLSQIERGRIGKPSATILYELSCVYAIDFRIVLQRAGFSTPSPGDRERLLRGPAAIFHGIDMTEAEASELLLYLDFIRRREGKQ